MAAPGRNGSKDGSDSNIPVAHLVGQVRRMGSRVLVHSCDWDLLVVFYLRAGGSVRNSLLWCNFNYTPRRCPRTGSHVEYSILLVCTRDHCTSRALCLPTGARFPTCNCICSTYSRCLFFFVKYQVWGKKIKKMKFGQFQTSRGRTRIKKESSLQNLEVL